jgi:hypothetical protein
MLTSLKSFISHLNEQEELSLDKNRPLKGYSGSQLIERIEELMEVLSDNMKFGVPSDMLGRATTYRDANGSIEKIKDVDHYYSAKGEDVKFYCWSISYRGSWKATKNLKQKIADSGGLGEEKLNINLKKAIEYFQSNPEDSDNVRSISISIDSKTVRETIEKSGADMDAED